MILSKLDRVLFIGAHADDVEMTSGGTLHKMASQGIEVMTLVAASSDVSRMAESRRALSELGCNQLHGLGLPDMQMDDHLFGLIQEIELHVQDFKPDMVVTHFHADTHQDHVAVYRAAVAAARKVKNFLMFKPTYPSGRPDIPFHASCISLLSEHDAQAKYYAISCFKSQVAKYGGSAWAESMASVAKGDAWQYAGVHGWAEVFQAGRIML